MWTLAKSRYNCLATLGRQKIDTLLAHRQKNHIFDAGEQNESGESRPKINNKE